MNEELIKIGWFQLDIDYWELNSITVVVKDRRSGVRQWFQFNELEQVNQLLDYLKVNQAINAHLIFEIK